MAATGVVSGSSTVLLGNTAIEPWGYSISAGSSEAFKVKAVGSGSVGAFHIYLGEMNKATSVELGLYTNSNGATSLLANGIIKSPKRSAWNEASISSSLKIEAGTIYWLAILGQGGSVRYRDAHQPCQSETSSKTGLTTLPQNWAKGIIYPECNISAYITAGEEKPVTTTTETTPTTPTETVTTPTVPVTTPTTPVPPVNPSSTEKNCFSSPGKCGYPDPAYHNVGVENCSSLKPSGSVSANTSGQKVEGLNISGQLAVNASNVTINNDCITTNGGAEGGSKAVIIGSGANNTNITNSTIRGENETNHSVEEAISNNNNASNETATKDYIYNCGECIHQAWTVNESYVIVNGMKNTSDHYEDWYFTDTAVKANDDTMFNPEGQTAIFFGDTHLGGGGAADNHLTVTNSLLAGGGYMFYPYGNASSAGSGSKIIKDNRLARCLSKCPDSNGYYPNGGYYGVDAYDFTGNSQVWEGNYWDNNLQEVPQG